MWRSHPSAGPFFENWISERSARTPLEVTLSPEDPIAYARAVERIAQHDDALLVDAYFRLDDVMPILSQTGVSRVLTSGRGGKKRTGAVAVALQQLAPGRPFEVRVHDGVHDRYVIPGSGPIDSIGTSLGGVVEAVHGYDPARGADGLRDSVDPRGVVELGHPSRGAHWS